MNTPEQSNENTRMRDYSFVCLTACRLVDRRGVSGLGWLACLLARRVKGHHPAL